MAYHKPTKASQKRKGLPPETVETPLSLHPTWEEKLDSGEKYTLMFMAKLPLVLLDAQGDKAAEGLLVLKEGLTVRSETSKPWMFIFLPQSLRKEEPDFSRWKVIIPGRA